MGNRSFLYAFFVGLFILIFKVAIPDAIVNIFALAAGILLIILGAFMLGPIIAQRLGLIHTKKQTDYPLLLENKLIQPKRFNIHSFTNQPSQALSRSLAAVHN